MTDQRSLWKSVFAARAVLRRCRQGDPDRRAGAEKYGAPVYVRHEIVHNRYVVEGLQSRGAIFVEELDEIPAEHRDQPVVFSAHGVPKSVPADAEAKNLFYLDATCPLVSKVHKQAMRHQRLGRHVILIGHSGHPEVIGTMGQLPDGAVTLIETVEDARNCHFEDEEKLGFVTQTTLSVDDTAGIIEELQARFPNLAAPAAESICYATTNRQDAVRAAAPGCDLFLIVGAPNSSNSSVLSKWRKRRVQACRCSCSALPISSGTGLETYPLSVFRRAHRHLKSSSTKSWKPSRCVSM